MKYKNKKVDKNLKRSKMIIISKGKNIKDLDLEYSCSKKLNVKLGNFSVY